MTADDVINSTYKFDDVVLPLPGNRVDLPPAMKDYYIKVLSNDGVLRNDNLKQSFRFNLLRINLSGSYRKVVEYPRKLNCR